METLADLGVEKQPIVVALNKIDRLPQGASLGDQPPEWEDSVPISALRGIGLDTLLHRIEQVLASGHVYVTVMLPFERGDLAALFHERGTVLDTRHDEQGTVLEGYMPRRWLDGFWPYMV